MMAKIIYVITFLIAFGLTTGGMIYLNGKYKNIFKFDFSPNDHSNIPVRNSPDATAKTEESSAGNPEQKTSEEIISASSEAPAVGQDQSVSRQDHAQAQAVGQPTKDNAEKDISRKLDSLKNIKQQELEQIKKKLAEKDKEVEAIKASEKAKEDSIYFKWTKTMAKIYEKMDAKAVAKIIQKLADNQARDILSSMKQNKVAQVLTQLDPETATRLTRIK